MKVAVPFLVLFLLGCYSNPVTISEFRELESTRGVKHAYPLYNLGLKDGFIHVEAYGRIYKFKAEDLPFAKRYPYSREKLEFKQDLKDQLNPEYLRFFELEPQKPE